LLSQSASGLYLVVYGAVVIVVILYFPTGISGAIGRAFGALSPRSPYSRTAETKTP
jgi:hypothetical protein